MPAINRKIKRYIAKLVSFFIKHDIIIVPAFVLFGFLPGGKLKYFCKVWGSVVSTTLSIESVPG